FWRRQGRQGRQGQVVRQGRQGQVLRQGRQVVRQGRQGQVLRQGRQVVRQGRQGQVRQGWQGQVFRQGQQVLRQGRQVWQRRRQVVSGLPLLWLPRPRAARDRRQPAPLRGSSPPARRVRQADAGAALLPPSGTPTAGRRLPTGRPAAPTRLPSGPPPRGSGTAGAGPGSHQQSVQDPAAARPPRGPRARLRRGPPPGPPRGPPASRRGRLEASESDNAACGRPRHRAGRGVERCAPGGPAERLPGGLGGAILGRPGKQRRAAAAGRGGGSAELSRRRSRVHLCSAALPRPHGRFALTVCDPAAGVPR
ncbi:unnamed protein product, partial [Prorocentrum cordatum]